MTLITKLQTGALAFVLAVACTGDSLSPSEVAGTYHATLFTLTEPTQTRDVLAAGGELTITLLDNAETSGRLFIPASITGTSDVDEAMTGTFMISGTTLRFNNQAADTFVRDMSFRIEGVTLRGSANFGGPTITVTLTRS